MKPTAQRLLLNEAMSSISADRRAPRLRARTRVRLHVFDNNSGDLTVGRIVEAETRDFAARGVFLADVQLPCATRLHLYIELPEGCIEVFGVVVHDRPRLDASGATRLGIGVRFTRIALVDEQRLNAFLSERREAGQAAIQAALVRLRAEQMSRRTAPTR